MKRLQIISDNGKFLTLPYTLITEMLRQERCRENTRKFSLKQY